MTCTVLAYAVAGGILLGYIAAQISERIRSRNDDA